jgi:TetR/AcrR family transcriptional repressor of nem operon
MTEAVQELSQRKGTDTRERILDVAEAAVLEKGFAATSIDELIAAVSITKSGFFYHFRDKGELAKALLARYIERENDLFDDLFRRADELNEDPLHGFLVGLKMMSEMFADLPNGHPGCLIASFCYQDRLFDKEIRQLNASAVLGWRKRSRASRIDREPLPTPHSRRSRRCRRYVIGDRRRRNHSVESRE